jgi:hypothetical protein
MKKCANDLTGWLYNYRKFFAELRKIDEEKGNCQFIGRFCGNTDVADSWAG